MLTRSPIAQIAEDDYWAVIFTSVLPAPDDEYGATADHMLELASEVPGFLGIESTRDATGLGITVSYWKTEESIRAWRQHAEHLVVQAKGREKWYEQFAVRVCRVQRTSYFRRA